MEKPQKSESRSLPWKIVSVAFSLKARALCQKPTTFSCEVHSVGILRFARRLTKVRAYRGNGSGKLATAYPKTAIAAAFSRKACGSILSSVSAGVW